MSMPLKPSKAEAQRFLDMLDPGGAFTFLDLSRFGAAPVTT